MDDSVHLKQSRHALLDGFDESGVFAVRQSRALVIGAGGLGCPAVTYLAASGIGLLHWVDGDVVDITNLARQTLYNLDDVGHPKVERGARVLQHLSPETTVIAEHLTADEDFLRAAVPLADVVLDCTDQWHVRQLINRICVELKTPLVSASALQWSGQLLTIDPRRDDQACYACVFDPLSAPEDAACGAFGVLGPMVGAMGCLQAAEALKLLSQKNIAPLSSGRASETSPKPAAQLLSLFDARSGCWQQIQVSRNPGCPVCGHSARK